MISSLATRLRPDEGLVLRPGYVPRWRELRRDWKRGASRDESSTASDMTRPAISRGWSNSASSYFCHPRKKRLMAQVLLDYQTCSKFALALARAACETLLE